VSQVTAFFDDRIIASGDRDEVTRHIEERYGAADLAAIRVFEKEGGHVVDLDYWDAGGTSSSPASAGEADRPQGGGGASSSEEGVSPASSKPRGRPKLGVTAREITLLPRQWDWLATQPGGASAAIRRLVEAARKEAPGPEAAREAAYRFMSHMCGDRPNYEEALRALYRGDADKFETLIAAWPQDVRTYVGRLLGPG
jgi:hypothetical protein